MTGLDRCLLSSLNTFCRRFTSSQVFFVFVEDPNLAEPFHSVRGSPGPFWPDFRPQRSPDWWQKLPELRSCPHFKDGRFIAHRQCQSPPESGPRKLAPRLGSTFPAGSRGLCPRIFSRGLRRRKKTGQNPGGWEARALLPSSGSEPSQGVVAWVTESGLRSLKPPSQNANSLFLRARSWLYYYYS